MICQIEQRNVIPEVLPGRRGNSAHFVCGVRKLWHLPPKRKEKLVDVIRWSIVNLVPITHENYSVKVEENIG